ncbi:MAG: metalloregulator ArsR/SmtB family transcription factor [Dehalococcoidia bacterium]|nr:metalloregulator ArsR/SmtB family transcription factor [Dehalococcoidia bacterium]
MSEAIPEQMLSHVAERFRVLGDTTRLAILRLLLQRGEMNVGEIVDSLGAGQANVSKHLRILHDAGVVRRRQSGTSAYYNVADDSITRLCDIVCDRLRDQAHEEARIVGVR